MLFTYVLSKTLVLNFYKNWRIIANVSSIRWLLKLLKNQIQWIQWLNVLIPIQTSLNFTRDRFYKSWERIFRLMLFAWSEYVWLTFILVKNGILFLDLLALRRELVFFRLLDMTNVFLNRKNTKSTMIWSNTVLWQSWVMR